MTVLNNVILAPIKVQKRGREEATEAALALLDRVGLKDKAGASIICSLIYQPSF